MTKLAPLVLICIVVLAIFSGVSIAFSCSITQQIEAALSNVNNESKVFAGTPNFEILGDPIDNPKPNKH